MTFDPTQHIFRSSEFRGLMEAAITFFNSTPVYSLPPPTGFNGSGVYALYYTGNNPLYTSIATSNSDAFVQPIYIGKTAPPGWRTARNPDPIAATLYGRLKQHANSIEQGAGIELADFHCRFMVLNEPESDLITVVESELFRRYTPVWNSIIDGFGNHDPGSGRYEQAKSEWDILHPGRPWAELLRGASPTQDFVIAKVKAALGG